MGSNQLSLSLETPEVFPKFPYDTPYDIQISLMKHLYGSIEKSKVAIVESPTGTVSTQLYSVTLLKLSIR
jgi:chromosome transmission fidelity protein 1